MMHWWVMMHWWWGTDDALMMNWWGADDALVMCWWCTEDAQMMHCQCTDDALLMHWWCSDDAQRMHWWCTVDAVLTHWWCTDDAQISYLISLSPLFFQKYSICRVFCAVWWYDDMMIIIIYKDKLKLFDTLRWVRVFIRREELELDHLSLPFLLSPQLKVFGSLDRWLQKRSQLNCVWANLVFPLAECALHLDHQLHCSLCLLISE